MPAQCHTVITTLTRVRACVRKGRYSASKDARTWPKNNECNCNLRAATNVKVLGQAVAWAIRRARAYARYLLAQVRTVLAGQSGESDRTTRAPRHAYVRKDGMARVRTYCAFQNKHAQPSGHRARQCTHVLADVSACAISAAVGGLLTDGQGERTYVRHVLW